MTAYGGFWRRVAAYLIDAIILYIAQSVILMIFGVGVGIGGLAGQDAANMAAAGMSLIVALISLVGQWLYFALMESSALQATVGKLALGVVVTDMAGNRISFGRATGRYFAKILSALILLIGFIMVGFTERKQGLHDLIAGTLVYKTRDPLSVRPAAGVFE